VGRGRSNMKNYYTLPHNSVSLSRWERFKLLFHKKYVAFDWGIENKDYSCAIFYKMMGNKIYVLGEEILPAINLEPLNPEKE
jgi:hypothetical protein